MSTEKDKADQERASQFKHELGVALATVAEVMDRARAAGFVLSWQGVPIGQTGRHEPSGITCARYY